MMPICGRELALALLFVGQELVERRIDRPDGHRPAVHGLEDAVEVLPLQRQELGQGGPPLLRRVGQDHLAHRADLALAEEHVLGPAEADPLGPEGDGVGRLVGLVGVGPDLEASGTCRPRS